MRVNYISSSYITYIFLSILVYNKVKTILCTLFVVENMCTQVHSLRYILICIEYFIEALSIELVSHNILIQVSFPLNKDTYGYKIKSIGK